MPERADQATPFRSEVDPGTEVEVQNAFDRSWSTGFVVSQVTDSGYVLRRACDASDLPQAIPFAAVRHRRNNKWWA